MSSAANHNRGPLEEEFQRRMHDAEASPSPDLWARIDHDLTIQESSHYKGRMVLYRQLAAACFVLFVLAGALLTYHFKQDEAAAIATVQLDLSPRGQNEIAKAAEGNVLESASPEGLADVGQEASSVVNPVASNLSEDTQNVSPLAATTVAEKGSNAPVKDKQLAGALPTAYGIKLTANSDQIFGGAEGAAKESIANKSAFTSLRPFYQTARQAITSIPPSFNGSSINSFARYSERQKSLVELSTTVREDMAAKQQRSEALAMALNNSGAEKEEKEGSSDSRWTLGMGYAPSYFNQNIGMPEQMMGTVSRYSLVSSGPDKTAESASNMDAARDEFEANTDPAFSYAVEVKTGFKLGKKLKLLSGLGFTQNTSRTKSSYIVKQFWIKPTTNERVAMPATSVFLPSLNNNFSTDSLSVDKTDDFYVNYRYRHVTLPVGLQYEGNINKDWFWYTSGGVAANFLVETTVMASNNEVKDVSYDYGDDSPFRKVQFSGNVSLGVGKRVAKAISVTAGPEFRGYFNSLLAEPDKALAPQGRPYTVGVNMSVNYDLSRR
ncbi:outer membrane beta-barrel protein [Pontibacter sp. MBLB2868]|uniref:outer membrane beta-barrel protein n=1 Tax=Pontibacter sp. MBLB2868 TaxID=3451555 RepID=UPI003F751461